MAANPRTPPANTPADSSSAIADSERSPSIGVVVIGRNEGERLKRCLRSLVNQVECMVYVDSGSSDGSQEFARSLNVDVIDLDMSQPFTMARGRNAGWTALAERSDPVEFVQFVDGDCEIVEGWIETASDVLQQQDDVVAVYGRRRERFPNSLIYNSITDIEWDHPIGESRACGGDALMRLDAIKQVGGYNPGMIAGEEPEMCVRLRRAGWRILRIDAEMTLHDAALTSFSQYWKRSIRSGHAYAEGAALHGLSPERHNVRPLLSIIFWAFVVPLFSISIACIALIFHVMWPIPILGIVLLAYAVQPWRIYRHCCRRGHKGKAAGMYSILIVVGKFAQFMGIAAYWSNRMRNRRTELIEYKTVESTPRS